MVTPTAIHRSQKSLICVTRPLAAGAGHKRVRRPDMVARVVTFLRDNPGEPVSVADLSRMVGVSERTLRAAFHDIIGVSPKRYAITQRLYAAHAALSVSNPQTTTVTDIATTFGFFELGRFAGKYRDTFGEVPSQTLRNTPAAEPDQIARAV